MSSVIKVNACVYSRIGYGRNENTNSFYLNGKFISEQHLDNVQASMENRGNEYLFALSDNMNCFDEDSSANISILKELGRYHEKITVNGGDLKSKLKELQSRIGDTERLMTSFLDMNRVSAEDPRRDLGFAGILFSDGQFAAASMGSCKVFLMRDGMFRALPSENTKAKRLIDAKASVTDGEAEDVTLPDEDPNATVELSDIYDVAEGDSFLVISNSVLEALGEEKIEDLLSLRSDSSYIAFRMVDEAMKRKFSGDLTAMVVQVEKLYDSGSSGKKVPAKAPETMKNRVDRLNRTPAVTYKYNRRKSTRYQSTLFVTFFLLTVAVLFGIIYVIISSIINTGNEKLPGSPTITAKTSPTPTPSQSVEPTEDPTEPVIVETPDPTPTPTPQAGTIQTHTVAKGDTISTIARKYYGTDSLADELCTYNGITDPNKIQIGQKIKIPPKEDLK